MANMVIWLLRSTDDDTFGSMGGAGGQRIVPLTTETTSGVGLHISEFPS